MHTLLIAALMLVRLCSDNTESPEKWAKTLKLIDDNRPACDEVWMCMAESFPDLATHRAYASTLAPYIADLRQRGIRVCIQTEATIGHGDTFISDEEKARFDKHWGGWTGSTGVEDTTCNCPRQPAFLQRLEDIASIYAPLHFDALWIDDDLRINNHRPATDNSHWGCWCKTCINAFNQQQNAAWTRETLSAAVSTNKALENVWLDFSADALANVARVLARKFKELSPETRMGLEYCAEPPANRHTRAILKALAAESGRKVGARAGAGAWYDFSPMEQIRKSYASAKDRMALNVEDIVDVWCPEIESYPRTYYCRTAQSISVEAFSAMAWGFNSVSVMIFDMSRESYALYDKTLMKPLARTGAFLKAYDAANKGSVPAGYAWPEGDGFWSYLYGCAGIPLLPGFGQNWKTLTKEDTFSTVDKDSSQVQASRETLAKAAPKTTAVLESPFFGLVIPRCSVNGALQTLALINTRIDSQGPIRVRLPGLTASSAFWHELGKDEVALPVEMKGTDSFVTVPSLAAWNFGYLSFKPTAWLEATQKP